MSGGLQVTFVEAGSVVPVSPDLSDRSPAKDLIVPKYFPHNSLDKTQFVALEVTKLFDFFFHIIIKVMFWLQQNTKLLLKSYLFFL